MLGEFYEFGKFFEFLFLEDIRFGSYFSFLLMEKFKIMSSV